MAWGTRRAARRSERAANRLDRSGRRDQPRDNRTGRYKGREPQGDGNRLTLDDLRRDHAMCDYHGTPMQELDLGDGKTAWGCPEDHSGEVDQ